MLVRICPLCGREFKTFPSQNVKYCEICLKAPRIKTCKCGAQFTRRPNEALDVFLARKVCSNCYTPYKYRSLDSTGALFKELILDPCSQKPSAPCSQESITEACAYFVLFLQHINLEEYNDGANFQDRPLQEQQFLKETLQYIQKINECLCRSKRKRERIQTEEKWYAKRHNEPTDQDLINIIKE